MPVTYCTECPAGSTVLGLVFDGGHTGLFPPVHRVRKFSAPFLSGGVYTSLVQSFGLVGKECASEEDSVTVLLIVL